MTQPQPDAVIGTRLFTDGITRPIYRGPDGREYVIGNDRGPVYGCRKRSLKRPSS
jgi:hypothetical protein